MAAQDFSSQKSDQKKPNYLGGVNLPNFRERVPEASMQENLQAIREKIENHNNLQNDLLAVEIKIAELNANGSADRAISPGAEDGTTRRLLRAISAHHEEIDKVGNEMEAAREEILKTFPALVNGVKDRRTIEEVVQSVKNESLRQKLEDMVHDVKHEANREFWSSRLAPKKEISVTALPVEDDVVSISSVMEAEKPNEIGQTVESSLPDQIDKLGNITPDNSAVADTGGQIENFDFTPVKESESAATEPAPVPPAEQIQNDQAQVDQIRAEQALPDMADSPANQVAQSPTAEETPAQEPVDLSIDSDKKIFEMFNAPDDNLVSSGFQVLPGGKLPPADDESLKKAA